jgi:hypothetical protein
VSAPVIAKASEPGKRGTDTCRLLCSQFGPGAVNEHSWSPQGIWSGYPAARFAELPTSAVGWPATLDTVMAGHDVVPAVPPADSNRDMVGVFGDTQWRELAEVPIDRMGW